jgi:hypothetical protein
MMVESYSFARFASSIHPVLPSPNLTFAKNGCVSGSSRSAALPSSTAITSTSVPRSSRKRVFFRASLEGCRRAIIRGVAALRASTHAR